MGPQSRALSPLSHLFIYFLFFLFKFRTNTCNSLPSAFPPFLIQNVPLKLAHRPLNLSIFYHGEKHLNLSLHLFITCHLYFLLHPLFSSLLLPICVFPTTFISVNLPLFVFFMSSTDAAPGFQEIVDY